MNRLYKSILSLAVLNFAWLSLSHWLHPFVKWVLRKTTGLCELQRIAYGEPAGAARSCNTERSLMTSRMPEVRKLVTFLDRAAKENRFVEPSQKIVVENAALAILEVKKIKASVHPQFVISFGVCVQQIWGFRQLLHQLERLRTTGYDCEDQTHEEKLLSLWSLLKPEEPLSSRVSRQWQSIGFQGDDPKTDFRGMGMLGLDNLMYFATEYNNAARQVLSHSNHPRMGYSFAIVGINLTSMALTLFREGLAKNHVFNINESGATIEVFHKFYCYVYYEFDKFWLSEKPRDLMEFGRIRDKFEIKLKQELMDFNCKLRMRGTVVEVV